MKDLLKTVVHSLSEKGNSIDQNRAKLQAVDYMDDGSKICLSVEIDGNEVRTNLIRCSRLTISFLGMKRKAKFDFTGTSEQVWYNWNAPRSISYSAIIYCLRAMIAHEIPLNQVMFSKDMIELYVVLQGCMRPIEVVLPSGSLLDPHRDAAVVGK